MRGQLRGTLLSTLACVATVGAAFGDEGKDLVYEAFAGGPTGPTEGCEARETSMLRRSFQALVGALVVGAASMSPGPLLGQSEMETVRSNEYGTVVRFRDAAGVRVERFSPSGGQYAQIDTFFDRDGEIEREETDYRDGRSETEHFAYGPYLPDVGKRRFARARNMSQEEMNGFLSRLPVPPQTSDKAELALHRGRPRPPGETAPVDPGHPWGYHWKNNLGGQTWTTFRLLHQEIEVEAVRFGESVRFGERWLRVSDSRGGMRHDFFTETAALEEDGHSPSLPAVASYDALGRIVHVVTNDEGYPTETWYGETVVARYHYAHVDGVRPLPPWGGLGDFWVELVDARTGSLLLDSRALPTTSAQPVFSALGGMIESVGEDLFAVVPVSYFLLGGRYALLPLEEGPVWRTVQAGGTEAPELRSQVHYTDDRLRIEFQFDHTSLVVEAPRRGSSAIKVAWPEDVTLPVLGRARPMN